MNDGSCPSPFYLTLPFLRWPAPPLLRFPLLAHTLHFHYQPDPTKGKTETCRQPRGHTPASVVRHRAAELRSDGERRREGRSGRTTCLLASSPSRSPAIHRRSTSTWRDEEDVAYSQSHVQHDGKRSIYASKASVRPLSCFGFSISPMRRSPWRARRIDKGSHWHALHRGPLPPWGHEMICT